MSDEVTDLLQHLIRNECVNDGTATSGHEVRSADVLESYLEGAGLDLERYEPAPGRTSLVGRIEGTDPNAPTLLLMGHTDVVPVNPDGWRHDPFGGVRAIAGVDFKLAPGEYYSLKSVRTGLEKARESWIEVARAEGRAIPPPAYRAAVSQAV